MVLRHAEHLHHVLARLGHHDAERGKQYREVGARPVYLQVLQRRSCFPIAPRGVQTTSCTSSPRLTMWSPSAMRVIRILLKNHDYQLSHPSTAELRFWAKSKIAFHGIFHSCYM